MHDGSSVRPQGASAAETGPPGLEGDPRCGRSDQPGPGAELHAGAERPGPARRRRGRGRPEARQRAAGAQQEGSDQQDVRDRTYLCSEAELHREARSGQQNHPEVLSHLRGPDC